MKNFTNFYEDKEYLKEEELNEVISELFLTQSAVLAFLAGTYAKKGITKILGFFKNRKKKKLDASSISKEIKSSPEVIKVMNDVEKIYKRYEELLKDIYSAIENKNSDLAFELFNNKPEVVRENPEIKLAIIQKILKSYKQPPLYVTSPGNETYQAIKKILGQKIAKAIEVNSKRSIEKYIESSRNEL